MQSPLKTSLISCDPTPKKEAILPIVLLPYQNNIGIKALREIMLALLINSTIVLSKKSIKMLIQT